jgi:hypothetical protein
MLIFLPDAEASYTERGLDGRLHKKVSFVPGSFFLPAVECLPLHTENAAVRLVKVIARAGNGGRKKQIQSIYFQTT